MLRILDALSGYTTAAGAGSYGTFVVAIEQTAGHIIDAKFTAWWTERHKVLAAAEAAAKAEPAEPRSLFTAVDTGVQTCKFDSPSRI